MLPANLSSDCKALAPWRPALYCEAPDLVVLSVDFSHQFNLEQKKWAGAVDALPVSSGDE
jgi:hypothetical protein